jgi:HK97 family phage prohead protease
MTIQHKNFDVERKDGWIVASTPTVDRDADRVMPLGMRLENYKANPVIMYGHQYGEPWSLIGRAADIQVDADGIRILPELREPVNDADPMCIIRALWDQGLLKAASIGFNPLRYADNPFGGKDISESELLEISLVPIPANQTALRLAVKGIGADEDTQDPRRKPPVCDEEPAAEKDAGEAAAAVAEAITDAAGDVPVNPDEEPEDVEDDPTKPTPEQELRLAAILSEFVNAIMPYLQQ